MSTSEKPSQPPSEPQRAGSRASTPRLSSRHPSAQSSLATARLTDATAEALLGADRPARLQMIAALVLGLVLVAIPLYLWRRPRSEAVTVTSETAASGSNGAVAGGPPTRDNASPAAAFAGGNAAGASENSVLLSEARVLECHDPGSHHTAATDCDHLAAIEKSLAQAIKDEASCLPSAAGGGTLVYVVDVSFQRKRNPIALTVPRDGRALKNLAGNPRAVASAGAACQTAVKRALAGAALDGVPHQHSRYKIAITATYGAR